MIQSVLELKGFKIHAIDGDLGHLDEFYFDDYSWTIRYLVVQTGTWLSDRRVLISPKSIRETEWPSRRILMALTQNQIRKSPDIYTDRPVSRQNEIDLHQYYGWDYYWVSPGVWEYNYRTDEAKDPHLRSTKEVIGYQILARDGEIGHSCDFLLDDETWKIQYMLVDTTNWWFGKRIIVSPSKIKSIIWTENEISVDLDRETIRSRPEYDPEKSIK